MKTKRLFILLVPALLLFNACEKFNITGDQESENEVKGNVTLHIKDAIDNRYETNQDTRTENTQSIEDICSRLSFAVFKVSEKMKSVNQIIGDEDFGTATFNLQEGTYRIVVIAHNGKGNCTISSPESIKFYKNKLTDTFYYYGTLEVGSNSVTQEIELARAVGMFKLHINDNIPQNVQQMKFYYTGGSSTLDATTGYGNVNSKQTENLNVATGTKDYYVYTFPHQDGKKIKFNISTFDLNGTELSNKVFENVTVKRNYITTYSGNFFDGTTSGGQAGKGDPTEEGKGSISFTFDPAWEGEDIVYF